MTQLFDLHFKPEALKRHGLPIITYSLLGGNLPGVSALVGELPLKGLQYGLHLRSDKGANEWEELDCDGLTRRAAGNRTH